MAGGTLTRWDSAPAMNGYGVRPADYVLSRSLAANTAEAFTIPAGARFGLFSATSDFYANYTTTATVPGDVTDGTASELNPALRFVNGVTSISVIAPATCVVTLSLWTD